MIISCPQCHIKYRVSDEKVKPEGTNVRCTRCGHVFVAHPEDDISASIAAENKVLEDTSQQPDVNAEQSDQSTWPGAQAKEQPKLRSTRRLWVLIVVLSLAAVALGGYLYWPDCKAWLFSESVQETNKDSMSPKANDSAHVKEIVLKNVRQYMVDNKNIGRILVIEGQAVNVSDKDKQEVALLASLFDHQGQKIGERTFGCKNTASLEQLQDLSLQELHDVLSAQGGELPDAFHIPPGQSADFMIFFDQYPDQVAEFSLKVVS